MTRGVNWQMTTGSPSLLCVETAKYLGRLQAQPKKGPNQKAFDRVFTQQQQLGQSPVSLEVIRRRQYRQNAGELLVAIHQQKYHIADYVVLKCLD